jgi:demethylmenaquinone methyltransferase / 2-methoxy-6-polyprenyl-1,4-benzoquinol methylase
MTREEGRGSLPPHPALGDYYADEAGHHRFLDSMFEATAHHYNRLNGLVSLGSGDYYRRHALRRAGLTRGMVSLDVATGTGLVAQAAQALVGPTGRVTGLDRNAGMLAEARRSVGSPLVQGSAERLPFRGDSFDFLSMAYALRHVSDLEVTFREYFRVLKPGRTVLILEFARPRSRVGLALGRLYLKRLVPWLARWRSGSREAEILMSYCWDTVEHCVPGELILDALTRAGFENVRRAGWFGVFVEYLARKPAAPPAAVTS